MAHLTSYVLLCLPCDLKQQTIDPEDKGTTFNSFPFSFPTKLSSDCNIIMESKGLAILKKKLCISLLAFCRRFFNHVLLGFS